jgi:hypothetical protein
MAAAAAAAAAVEEEEGGGRRDDWGGTLGETLFVTIDKLLATFGSLFHILCCQRKKIGKLAGNPTKKKDERKALTKKRSSSVLYCCYYYIIAAYTAAKWALSTAESAR